MTDVRIKLVLLGDTQVGKSSIVVRYAKNEFDQYRYPTIGATFLTQKVELQDYIARFQIWDTAGQEKYKSLAPLYYKGAQAALVVYDITNRESFDNALKWVTELKETEGAHVVIGLAGNKLDLEGRRKVQKVEAQNLAEKQGFIFQETSAKTGENIQDIFRLIAEKVPRSQEGDQENKLIDIQVPKENKKRRCC